MRRLPCSLFCLVLSCVQVKGEAHWGTMRRTDDGIDPLEVADGGKKFARPNIQEFLFFLRTEILCPWVKNCKEAVGRS